MLLKRLKPLSSLLLLLVIISCGKPTTVAEKALKLVGVGTFVPSATERYIGHDPLNVITLFTDHDDLFSNALLRSNEAEFLMKNGYYKETPKRSFFNFSDVMFDHYKMIEQRQYDIKLYDYIDYNYFKDLFDDESGFEKFKKMYVEYDNYKEHGEDYATWIAVESIPVYSIKYSMDNKYIANIKVIKLPHYGFRVCSFTIE